VAGSGQRLGHLTVSPSELGPAGGHGGPSIWHCADDEEVRTAGVALKIVKAAAWIPPRVLRPAFVTNVRSSPILEHPYIRRGSSTAAKARTDGVPFFCDGSTSKGKPVNHFLSGKNGLTYL